MGLPRELRHNMRAIYCKNRNAKRCLGPGINAVIGAVILLEVIGFFQKTD